MRVRECWYLLRLCCSGVDILRTSFHLFGVSCAERNGLMATGGKIEQKHLVLSLFYALAAVYSLIVSTPETTIGFRLSCAVHRQLATPLPVHQDQHQVSVPGPAKPPPSPQPQPSRLTTPARGQSSRWHVRHHATVSENSAENADPLNLVQRLRTCLLYTSPSPRDA